MAGMLPVLSTVFAILFTLTAALAIPAKGRAADGSSDEAAAAEARAAEIRRQLEEIRQEVVTFTAEEEALAAQLDAADQTLSRERRKAAALRAEAEAINSRVVALEADAAALARRIDRLRLNAGRRLRAWYRMSHLHRIDLLVTAESFTDLVRQQTSLERVIDHDESILAKLHRETDRETAILADLRAQQAEKVRLAAARRDHEAEIERAQAERRALLERVRTDKSAALTAAKSLKQAARDLDQRITALRRRAEPPPSVEKNGDAPFTSVKGSLTMPVRGKIISFFGPRRNTELNVVTFQSGIDIRASHGDPIRAVHSGRVVFSSRLKGYGNVLIIDHGDSFYTVYGHADAVHKATGETVRAEEVIATVGDTGSLKGPMLHFEIRHHGTPVDPMEWLNHSRDLRGFQRDLRGFQNLGGLCKQNLGGLSNQNLGGLSKQNLGGLFSRGKGDGNEATR